MLDRLRAVGAPGERRVIHDEHGGNLLGETPRGEERLDDDKASIALVVAFDFRLRERPRHRHLRGSSPACVVPMQRISGCLGERRRELGVRVHDRSAGERVVNRDASAYQRTAAASVHHLSRLERHRDDVRWRQLRVGTPLGLMANTPAWRSTTDRLPNVPKNESTGRQLEVGAAHGVAEPIDCHHSSPAITSLGAGDSRLADRQEPFHHAVEPCRRLRRDAINASWSARYST